MHEQLVSLVPAVPFVCVPQVVYQIMDVVFFILGVNARFKCFYFTEQGVHRQLAFRLFLLEILDAVHLDLYELFLFKHLEI